MGTNQASFSHRTACLGPLETSQPNVRELGETDTNRVLEFLAEDALRGVHLRSMIQDHGLCHPAHRGRFFGYFEDQRLTGLALLGHVIMIVAEPAALPAFAQAAIETGAEAHLIFGPKAQVESFWEHFAQSGRQTSHVRDHYWYICQQAATPLTQLQLRRAGPAELEVVAEAQAEMVKELSRSDPRQGDAEGFRRRVADRIEQKRTWVKVQDGQVIFKAELQSVTEEVVYLEGIWTHPEHRGRGVGRSCLGELVHRLLKQHLVLCLAVEPEDEVAQRVYQQVGFGYREDYQVRFFKPRA